MAIRSGRRTFFSVLMLAAFQNMRFMNQDCLFILPESKIAAAAAHIREAAMRSSGVCLCAI
jgi:hypothetical protein